MNIDQNTILQTYIQTMRVTEPEKQKALTEYTCQLLGCSPEELAERTAQEDTYHFLQVEIPKFINKLVPGVIAEHLPVIRELDAYCKAGETATMVKDMMRTAEKDGCVHSNPMRQFLQIVDPSKCAPYLEHVTGRHKEQAITMTVTANVDAITRKVTFTMPKEFQNDLHVDTKNQDKLKSLSEIETSGVFQGTELWYDDHESSELDRSKAYQMCVDPDGTIPVMVGDDMILLIKWMEEFLYGDVHNVIRQDGERRTAFYLYLNDGTYIGAFRRYRGGTRFFITREKEE